MMGIVIGMASGAGLAFAATKLPNRWFVFPVRFILFGMGMVIIGNSLFSFFLRQGSIQQ